jgi:Right handed beta helix region
MPLIKFALPFWILFAATFAHAANKYVAPGGSGNGSSWSTPAGTSAINSSSAGDVVYLAGGNYGNGIAVSVSGSASNPLTIRRATAADHGADTGWQASMDAQAVFNTGWSVTGQGITIDGNCWKPPGLPTKFGILIKFASGAKGIDAGGSGGNITVRNVDLNGPGINSSKKEADGIHFPPNSLITGCAVHDTDALLFCWKGNQNSTVEYCYLFNASSNIVFSGNSQDPHPDVLYSGGMLTNGTMRWCVVANVTSEGVFFDQELPGDNMVFMGNIMFQGDCQTGNTPIQLQNGAAFGRVFLYHNTFVDFNKSNNLGPGTSTAAGGACVNNLFINYLPNWDKGVNNNGFSSTGIGSGQITNAASPFVTSGTYKWVKGSGTPPATRVTTGAPIGYNPSGMETAFALADGSWAKSKAVSVPAGMNVDMYGNSGNNLGAIQGAGGSGPTPTPAPSPTPTPTPAPTPPAGNKFKSGDAVTPTAVLNVRSSPAGTVVGQHNPGDVGIVVSGPTSAPLNGTPVNWYLIGWDTAPSEGYSGDDDLTKTTLPSPTPTPAPTPPQPTPTPSVTYKEWTNKLNTNQSDWISKHPPYPDGE